MRMHGQRGLELSITKDFDGELFAVHDSSFRKMFVKPRFGRRRCNGIWPPSKPRIMREPLRER
jgi:hypothetical protein